MTSKHCYQVCSKRISEKSNWKILVGIRPTMNFSNSVIIRYISRDLCGVKKGLPDLPFKLVNVFTLLQKRTTVLTFQACLHASPKTQALFPSECHRFGFPSAVLKMQQLTIIKKTWYRHCSNCLQTNCAKSANSFRQQKRSKNENQSILIRLLL